MSGHTVGRRTVKMANGWMDECHDISTISSLNIEIVS